MEVEVLSRGNGIHWDEAIRVLSVHGGQQNLPFHKPTAVLKILFISVHIYGCKIHYEYEYEM